MDRISFMNDRIDLSQYRRLVLQPKYTPPGATTPARRLEMWPVGSDKPEYIGGVHDDKLEPIFNRKIDAILAQWDAGSKVQTAAQATGAAEQPV